MLDGRCIAVLSLSSMFLYCARTCIQHETCVQVSSAWFLVPATCVMCRGYKLAVYELLFVMCCDLVCSYCECFANGEFCNDCNCCNCFNNLQHEEERSRAVKACLDRNPHAFHPKIGEICLYTSFSLTVKHLIHYLSSKSVSDLMRS